SICPIPSRKEAVSKVDLRSLFSPKGTNSIAGGTAPGCQQPFDQPCKGCITPMRCNPLQGWSSIRSLPGAVPPAIEFVPFGDEIGRGFDTPSLRLGRLGQPICPIHRASSLA